MLRPSILRPALAGSPSRLAAIPIRRFRGRLALGGRAIISRASRTPDRTKPPCVKVEGSALLSDLCVVPNLPDGLNRGRFRVVSPHPHCFAGHGLAPSDIVSASACAFPQSQGRRGGPAPMARATALALRKRLFPSAKRASRWRAPRPITCPRQRFPASLMARGFGAACKKFTSAFAFC